MNEYQLELPGDSVYFSAENDDEAIKKAKELLGGLNKESKRLKPSTLYIIQKESHPRID